MTELIDSKIKETFASLVEEIGLQGVTRKLFHYSPFSRQGFTRSHEFAIVAMLQAGDTPLEMIARLKRLFSTPMFVPQSDPNWRTADYLKAGHVYNLCYTGPIEEYKRQNGQRTERITKIEPDGKYQSVQLYSPHPTKVKSPLLEGSIGYWDIPSLIASQSKNIITEVTDESQYFRHSIRMSVTEAVNAGLITKKTIEYVFRDISQNFTRTNPIVCHSDWKSNKPPYFSLQLKCEPNISDNPYLQTIVFVWDTQEQLEADVRTVFPGAWFMR